MGNKSPLRKRVVILLIIALIGVIVYFAVNQLVKIEPEENLDKLSISSKSTISPSPTAVINPLQNIVQAALEGTKGTYGVVIKNLKTGQSYSIGEDKVFEAGSLYKLWVMAVAVQKIQTGEWRQDQVLTEDIATLNEKFDIEPGLAEQTEGTVTFTVRDALEQMITISHNYAALLLSEKLRLATVAKFLQDEGLNESKIGISGGAPTTTPSDIALFFEKLYLGKLANYEFTNQMLDLLKKQKLNNKLPKYLPQNTDVAHKTGEIGWFSHDGGIVYSPKGDYIIVILSESNSPAVASERIAKVSKAVYEYFTKGSKTGE